MPENDVATVRQWAEAKTPPEFRDRIRVEVDLEPRSVIIVESSRMGGEWLRVPSAKLLWTGRTQVWTLYSFDRNSAPRRYEFLEPSRRVRVLIDEIDRDPTFIFWGWEFDESPRSIESMPVMIRLRDRPPAPQRHGRRTC